MDKDDVQMVDAEKNVPASDVLVSNESPVKYENGVKTEGLIGISNAEDKTNNQSDSKGEDLKNTRSETEDQRNTKSLLEADDNVLLRNKTPTIDDGTDDMVSVYLKVIDDEVQKINEGELNEVHQSEKMIYKVNQNGNDIMVDRQEDHQMKTNATTVTTNGARLDEFAKVKIKFTDSFIGKMPKNQ
ncbi:hypothetical protein MTR67_035522 [Solanum verrucosum]|uniref:Uncharacterized protein n=1 Tax=Solanum verrucosum TaxID=315347 RepID=A0AAF0ZKD2_SOLVR|nr:hypothetical protein MTR67_035522 [Solanum verrucosum]